MKLRQISGYLVVQEEDDSCRHPYRGIDRLPWDTVDAGYYNEDLPPEIKSTYQAICAEAISPWWPVGRSLEEASALRKFSETRSGLPMEVIAVQSCFLDSFRPPSPMPVSALFLGSDVVSVGEWSLVKHLLDAGISPGISLNKFGLFDAADVDVNDVLKRYRASAARGLVEEIAGPESGVPVERVTVYSIETAWN